MTSTTHGHHFSSRPPRYSTACSILSSLGAHSIQPESFQIGGGQDALQVVIFITEV